MVKIRIFIFANILFFVIFDKNINAQAKNIPDNLPFHTKILWGEKGILRKTNFTPKNRTGELKLRVKMLSINIMKRWQTIAMIFLKRIWKTHLFLEKSMILETFQFIEHTIMEVRKISF